MSVRPRVVADLPGCVRALQAVHAADGYPARWPENPIEWFAPAGWAAALVAEVSGTVVGHVTVVPRVDDPVVSALTGTPPARLAMVSRLFVAPAARGRGLGAALLVAVSRYAAAAELQLMLDVIEDGGPAVMLYERLGWRLVDRRLTDWRTAEGHQLPVRVYLAPERSTTGP